MANAYNYECFLPESGKGNFNTVFNKISEIIGNCPNAEKGRFFFDIKESGFGSSTKYSIRDASFDDFFKWMDTISKRLGVK